MKPIVARLVPRLLIIASFLVLSFASAQAATENSTVNRKTLIELTNIQRTLNGLPVLKESAILNEVAMLKAEDEAGKGYFAHTSPEGKDPWHWFKIVGYNYKAAGENLAVLYSDSGKIVAGWMDSPSHKANILGAKYTEIGVAVVAGVFRGAETSYVVEVFGSPTIPVKATKRTVSKTVALGKTKAIPPKNLSKKSPLPSPKSSLLSPVLDNDTIKQCKPISRAMSNVIPITSASERFSMCRVAPIPDNACMII